ncbi:hypothetical protein [Bacteroides sp. Marseille-P3684]|uniref:hypothetical protein n=1 Tax=Bacteroides sp. Marseille-P3684 TaxID=2086579 RepID=UPI000D0B9F57|nr:hypothetical protein [Bacteroides sp. Marseille-P3684]
MRTIEFGYFLVLIGVIFAISLFLVQSTDAVFNCGVASFIFIAVGYFLVSIDPRDLKEDWEVKEIEERWAEKKRAREQRRLQKQNGKAKH